MKLFKKKKSKIVTNILIIFLLLINLNISYVNAAKLGIDNASTCFNRFKEDAKSIVENYGGTYKERLESIKENYLGESKESKERFKNMFGGEASEELRKDLISRIDSEILKIDMGIEESTELTQNQKEKIENDVNNWISSNKNSSNYKQLLEQQMNLVPSGYTKEELEYRKKLYEAEYNAQEIAGWKNTGSKPANGTFGTYTPNSGHTSDEIINEAKDFMNIGKGQGGKIDQWNLKSASDTLFNILLIIGIFLSVAIGIYLGIKFMLSSAEDKAKVKESLIPYIAGCVVIFGAFIIWKLVIILFGGMS